MISGFYSPRIAEYQLLITFGLAGVTKLFEATSKQNQEMFPALPKWFWPMCGVSELAICGFQYMGRVDLAMYLSFVLLGGIFAAVATLRNAKGRTVAQETKGLLFLPGLWNLVATVSICEENNISLSMGAAAFVLGIITCFVVKR